MPSTLVFGQLVLGKWVVESGAMTPIDKALPTPQQKSYQGCLEDQGRFPGEEASGWFLKVCVILAAGSVQCSMPHAVCGLCPA